MRSADRLGVPYHPLEVAVRTGDTPSEERARFLRRPADILITTPEALYLMLTSNVRENLRSVEEVIVDEIHAVAATKRGTRLFLSLERLEALRVGRPLQRIGQVPAAPPPALLSWGGLAPIAFRFAAPLRLRGRLALPPAKTFGPPTLRLGEVALRLGSRALPLRPRAARLPPRSQRFGSRREARSPWGWRLAPRAQRLGHGAQPLGPRGMPPPPRASAPPPVSPRLGS